jgi:hypothetical protein
MASVEGPVGVSMVVLAQSLTTADFLGDFSLWKPKMVDRRAAINEDGRAQGEALARWSLAYKFERQAVFSLGTAAI